MASVMKFICVFLVVGTVCFTACIATDAGPGEAIQIVVPVNHVFELHTDQMKPILEHENIKNRNIVVVSIAGAFRQGKSFMLNFFLRYLHAQVSQSSIYRVFEASKRRENSVKQRSIQELSHI